MSDYIKVAAESEIAEGQAKVFDVEADNTRVVLSHPIRVMILYGTALATEAGPVLFFDDIYGHDRRLVGLLARS